MNKCKRGFIIPRKQDVLMLDFLVKTFLLNIYVNNEVSHNQIALI